MTSHASATGASTCARAHTSTSATNQPYPHARQLPQRLECSLGGYVPRLPLLQSLASGLPHRLGQVGVTSKNGRVPREHEPRNSNSFVNPSPIRAQFCVIYRDTWCTWEAAVVQQVQALRCTWRSKARIDSFEASNYPPCMGGVHGVLLHGRVLSTGGPQLAP
jgi:hypothetical protein